MAANKKGEDVTPNKLYKICNLLKVCFQNIQNLNFQYLETIRNILNFCDPDLN